MNELITINHLLEIENNSEFSKVIILNNEHIPFWSIIRWTFYQVLMNKLFYTEEKQSKPNSSIRKINTCFNAIHHMAINHINLNGVSKHDILISTTASRYVAEEKRLFNVNSDFLFNAQSEKSIVIETFSPGYSPNKRACNKIISNNPYYFLSKIPSISNQNLFENDLSDFFKLLAARTEKIIGVRLSKKELEWLSQYSLNECKRFKKLNTAYKKLLKKLGTKLLIIQCGHYGGTDALSIISAAKSLNVVVAEFQHGSISQGHIAYNYSDQILYSELYKNTWPDYLLTYGVSWNERTNITSKKIAIGNPMREKAVKMYLQDREDKVFITILGDGLDTKKSLSLCYRIRNVCEGKYKVLFRPHPMERIKVLGMKIENIEIDVNDDIYKSFANTAILIGELSTALYEAIGLVDRIVVWDTSKSKFSDPTAPFEKLTLSNENECSSMLKNLNWICKYKTSIAERSYWEPHWQNNYKNFLKNVLG